MENEKFLNANDVLGIIRDLAQSQGMYGRLYRNIMETENGVEQLEEICKEQKFKDSLDFILWYEC